MDRRELLAVGVAGVLASLCGPALAVANQASLPPGKNFRADAERSGQRARLVVVLFSLPDCPYCDQVRREQLAPLMRDHDLAERLVVREVSIVGARTLIDFRGSQTTEAAFAKEARAKFSPTVAFFDPAGDQVVPAIVGTLLPDFYGAYLDDAIQLALLKIGNPVPLELTPQRVSDRVYFFRGESSAASTSNRGYTANAGFVVTDDGVVAFDALGSPVLGDAMIRAIRRVTKQPIRRLILSHYHADHFYGAQSFKMIGTEIWSGERGKAYLESDLALLRLQERRHDLAPDVDARTRLVPADRWLAFSGEKPIRFTMGNTHFRIIDVGGAHSPEDLMLFVEEDRVLFAGDLFFTGRIPYVGNADSRAWLAALDKMAPLHSKVVLPGHGDVSNDPEKDVALTRDYLVYLRATMGAAASDLSDFDEAYRNTDWSRFASYPTFKEANRLNAYGTYLLMQQESLRSNTNKKAEH